MKFLSQAKLGSWKTAMKSFWCWNGVPIWSKDGKAPWKHSGCWNEVPTSSQTGKLENHHETILLAGIKFLSEAKVKIAMKLFWLLE
jgi:hypothetical protein